MKTIAYYVSDAGFGHVTRSLALIESILENTDYHIYFSCGKPQTDYAEVYLINQDNRCTFQYNETEAELAYYEDTLKLDPVKVENNVIKYMEGFEAMVEAEVNRLQGLDVQMVITDITLLGIEVAKRLGVKAIGISNYTWYHRFKKLGLSKETLDFYLTAYNQLDKLYQLALHDTMEDLTCPMEEVGFMMRKVNFLARVDLQKAYWPACYLSIGQVAAKEEITINFQAGHVFVTGNVKAKGDGHVIMLPKRVSHSQDYVAASSIALVKPGWSTIAECLIIGLPFGIIDVEGTEDSELVEKLGEMDCCFKLHEDALDYIDIKKLNKRAQKHKPKKMEDSTDDIQEKILSNCC